MQAEKGEYDEGEIKRRLNLVEPLLIKAEAGDKMADAEGFKEIDQIDVNVMLPFDPVDIKKNFPDYWQQSNIDSTKRRNRRIGEIRSGRDKMEIIKMMLVVGGFTIAAVVVLLLLG